MLLVVGAVTTSMVVFSEPAVADVLMLATIVGLPILGRMRVGIFMAFSLVLWMVIVGLGVGAAAFSPTFASAVKHQLITLFLVLGGVVLGGYIAGDPVRRFYLIMWCYVAACMVTTVTALAGYFNAFPGAFELFTSFGRARGTFKDPNVYGAAVVPALTFVAWHLLREPCSRARVAALIGLPLTVGLLLSFSRGAWLSTVVALIVLFAIVGLRSRRQADINRFLTVATAGAAALIVGLVVLLQIEQVRELMAERFSFSQSYDQGPDGRFGGQAKAIGLVAQNPLGIGTHTFRELHHHEEPHNVYLTMFLNAGWLGGLLYIIAVLATLLVGLRQSLINNRLQGPLIVMVAAFASLVFEGAVIDTDHWRHFFFVMGCLWGLIDATPPATADYRQEDQFTWDKQKARA